MDGKERKKEPSLPPDYVSLAQLQERWLQKQEEEKKLKEKEEEERKKREMGTQNENQNQRGLINDVHEKMLGGSLRDGQRRSVGKDGREMGVIQEKGKGKEIVIGGFENGEGNNKKKKKKRKKKHFEKKKSVADGVKGNEVEKEKRRSEIKECDGGNRSEGTAIVPGNEVKMGQGVLRGKSSGKIGISGGLKGIEEIASVSMVEVLPRHGVRREIPDVKRMDFRGGFRRNGDNNRVSGYKSKTEYKVKLNELKETEVELASEKKMEDVKGYGKKWRERRNGDYRASYCRLKEGTPDISKGNEVEPELEKKAEDEVCSKTCGLNGRDRNGFSGQIKNRSNNTKEHRVEGEEELSDDKVSLEKKIDDEVLLVDSAKNGKKVGVGNGYRRYGKWRENINRQFGGLNFNGCRAGKVRSMLEVNVGDGRRYGRSGRFGDRWKMEGRESGMMWVKKEEKPGADAPEDGSSGISVDRE